MHQEGTYLLLNFGAVFKQVLNPSTTLFQDKFSTFVANLQLIYTLAALGPKIAFSVAVWIQTASSCN